MKTAPISTSAALENLGVHPGVLTPVQTFELDEKGWLMLPRIFSVETADRFARLLDLLGEIEGEEAGREVHQEKGTARLANLVEKSPAFWTCFSHPLVLAGIAHVLGADIKLSSLNARAALPGEGLQGLHTDWHSPVMPGDYRVCNSIWLVDDFTFDNGATRGVPGSHRSLETPGKSLDDPLAPHPDEQRFIAPRGTVFVFNSHTWHGGTLNRTHRRRRAIHAYFCRRDQPQQLDQRSHLSPAMIDRLSPEQRWLLDVA